MSYALFNEGNSFYDIAHSVIMQLCMHLTYEHNYNITKQHNHRAVYL